MRKFYDVSEGLPVISARTYANPIPVVNLPGDDTVYPLESPDPYIIRYNGMYYCYASAEDNTPGVPVLRSKDLINWEHLGYCLMEEGHQSYWAPCVAYHNGIFYMYYSSRAKGEEDVHYEWLKMATSTKPEGPFKYQKTLFNTFSIDAHVVKDEDGQWYLFYSPNNFLGIDYERPGTVILVDRLIDMMTPEGNPKLVVKPSIDEEIFERNRFGDGRDWHTIEGAFYMKRKGNAYVMYSGNAYTHKYYFVGYSVNKNDKACNIKDMVWDKYPDSYTYSPFLTGKGKVTGTGHNSVIKAPDNITDYVAYHGRNYEVFNRYMRIDKLMWAGDKMWLGGPSSEKQDAPAMPTYRDLFEYADIKDLEKLWTLNKGDWKLGEKELIQQIPKDIASAVLNKGFNDFIMEISLKGNPTHMGALYGVYLSYKDELNNLQLLLDEGKGSISAVALRNGITQKLFSKKLHKDFNFKSYHNLFIKKLGYSFKIYLDDVLIKKLHFDSEAFQIGLISYYTSASFAGLSITECIELGKDNEREFVKLCTVLGEGAEREWSIEGGKLLCKGSSKDCRLVINNKLKEAAAVSVDFKVFSNSAKGCIEVYPLYKDENNYVKVQADTEKQLLIAEYKEKGTVLYRIEEEKALNLNETHTIYMAKNNSSSYILIDKTVLLNEKINIINASLALFSSVPAEFENIYVVHNN